MDRPLTHEEVQDLLGAYALDAVDADEAAAIEDHLRDCPRCRAEVEDHRETAAMLAHVGGSAPPGVWDKIAAQLDDEAPPDFAAGVGARIAAAADLADAPELAVVTPLADAQPRADRAGRPDRQSRLFRVAAAALAAAAVLAAVLGVQVVRLDRRLDRMTAAVGRTGIDQAALAAMTDPSARRVHLQGDGAQRAVDAVLLPNGQAYLVSTSLPALSADQTYQLWAVVGGDKISVGVLGPEPGVVAFRYSAQPSALAITAERSGGVVASQNQPVVLGTVPPLPA